MRKLIGTICIVLGIIICYDFYINYRNNANSIKYMYNDDFERINNISTEVPERSVYELSYFSLDNIDIKFSKLNQEVTNTETEVIDSGLNDTQKQYIEKYKDIIVCDGVISDISLYIITKRLDALPSNVLALFKSNSWSVRIVDYQLESIDWGTDNTGSFTALTDINNKTIWIENTNNALANSTCHEFGHFVDYISGLTSGSEDFNTIYLSERNIFNDSTRESNKYAISSTSEYFASVFSEYCLNQDWGSSGAYKSFSWINNIIENL